MPSKIPFRVVSASSQEEFHKASELNVHSPSTEGWQTDRSVTNKFIFNLGKPKVSVSSALYNLSSALYNLFRVRFTIVVMCLSVVLMKILNV